jgi:hypothetical protein
VDNIEDLTTNIVAIVSFRDFPNSQNNLAGLILLISKECNDPKEGMSVS